VKRILIALPEDLHRQMKSEAAKEGATVKDFVTEAIRQAVKKGGKQG
jgi:predicted HicB family RNase H-like nuclease